LGIRPLHQPGQKASLRREHARHTHEIGNLFKLLQRIGCVRVIAKTQIKAKSQPEVPKKNGI
jgi:hypothetical protein